MAVIKPKLCEVNLQPSLQLLLILLFCLGAASLALWHSHLALGIKLLLQPVIITGCWFYIRHHIWLQHPASIKALRLINNQWRVQLSEGWFRAWPEGEVVVTSFLICCRMRVEEQTKVSWLILWSDSADPIELHSLRLKLMLDGHSCL